MLDIKEIRIRDPFIFTDKKNSCYYMYGTTALENGSIRARTTFSVYKTYDLKSFEAPVVAFDGEACGFWADRDFWAPELHEYKGKFYLFGSCKSADRCRATQIFVSDSPMGPFSPLSDKPVTPEDWECLDGTLWVENGIPYIVFCHEWLQVKNGEICALRLSEDLTHSLGEPTVLFKATDEPAVTAINKPDSGNYVTDGPFLFTENGRLKMIWSSFCRGRYMVLEAESDSLLGKWEHHGSRFPFDGGHAMLFHRLDGKRMISLHSPNTAGLERAVFFEY